MAEIVFGWDVGGAHVKACRTMGGVVHDVAQWPCPLWQGLEHLHRAVDAACDRWPDATRHGSRHALTMTGEMVDLFPTRQHGVERIAAQLAARLAPAQVSVWTAGTDRGAAGEAGDACGWCAPEGAGAAWQSVASMNWLATARHAAQALPHAAGVLVDIGSTTTDLTAFGHGRVPTACRSDADRLASGALVYHGVTRTPLCAVARRIAWRGRQVNVMNEFFATSADVYRLLGSLDPAHDQHTSADGQPKDTAATRQRLARMIGLDGRDGSADDWLAVARAWRDAQLDEIAMNLQRVLAGHRMGPGAVLVGAGCGDFLVPELATRVGLDRCLAHAHDVARVASPALAGWVQVCAPAVAVAALLAQACG